MNKIAEIIVDISLMKLDKVYDYIIPKNLLDRIQIGNLVKVSFGRRKVIGFVVNIKEDSNLKEKKLKAIDEMIIKEKLFDKKMLKLLKYIADYYHSYLIQVIKTALPAGLIYGKISDKKEKYINLAHTESKTREIIKMMDKRAYKQKEILELLIDNKSSYTISDLAKLADTSPSPVYRLIEKNYLKRDIIVKRRNPYKEYDNSLSNFLQPNKAQKNTIEIIINAINKELSKTFLLHGVTGSGKTEVYLHIIRQIINNDKSAIILVPEISLTPQLVKRFYSRFKENIAVLHSNLSRGERYDEWKRVKNGEAKIVIGARSAIFAPVQNLGLIIIDEEHENTYKQDDYPHYHAKKVAEKRAEIENSVLILGSATPSIESYFLAKKRDYIYLQLPNRIHQRKLPPVEIIDMREELKNGNFSIFSSALKKAMINALNREEQILLFLNRRGYASFMMCRECGHVIKCDNCDISLSYHKNINKLRCHYCDNIKDVPKRCPNCGSKYIKQFGIGTERIEIEAKSEFSNACVVRMDRDTTRKKGSYRKILKKLENKEIDILVGTQMIAKGHDYPNISVVGVITADIILNLPDFRAAEKTFQLLTQVAGRTGRKDIEGNVLIQTYTPEHYSIEASGDHDYEKFYKKEISIRKELNYPPFSKILNITIKDENNNEVIKTAKDLNSFLLSLNKKFEINGPSPAPIEKIKNNYRWQFLLKFKNEISRDKVIKDIESNFLNRKKYDVNINIDVDPQTML